MFETFNNETNKISLCNFIIAPFGALFKKLNASGRKAFENSSFLGQKSYGERFIQSDELENYSEFISIESVIGQYFPKKDRL